MHISKGFLLGGLVAVVGVVWLWSYGCDERPTCSWPEPEPPKDYIFYFNDASYPDRYYRYFSASKRVDSLTIPYESRSGFAVSADGTRLYLPDANKTVVVSADSLQVIAEIGFRSTGGVAVSPNGEYVSIIAEGVRILKTSDYSIIFTDTVLTTGRRMANGVFSSDSRGFYCVGGWVSGATEPPYVYTVDMSNPEFEVLKYTFPDGGAWRVMPSVDRSKLFLFVKYSTFGYIFETYDLAQDSIIFRDPLTPGAGDMEITPDGKFVFYTNPGTMLVGPPPPPFFTVYDVERNEIHKEISILDYTLIQHLAISPDGRKLVAEGGPGIGEFIVLDVASMEITEHYDMGNLDIWNVICQNGF